MRLFLGAAVLLLAACNQQQAQSAGEAVGKAYNASYRDNVIKNWQSHVADTERCVSFKERFKSAGERHESAASGAFVNDMLKIEKEVKAAGCEHSP